MPSPLTSPASDTGRWPAPGLTLDLEAAAAGGDLDEVDRAREAVGPAEYHMGRTAAADDQVVGCRPR